MRALNATQDARFSATAAAEQLDNHVALLKATAAGLAANPQIAKVFDNPEACTLSFEGLGGPDKGHLDIIRADGTVACTSRKLTDDPPGAGYAKSAWLPAALRRSAFLAPVRDDRVGGQVAIASAPIPGGKGFVAAFSDLTALGPHLASIYGGGRPTDFLVLTADHRTVVARSKQASRWIGTQLAPAHVQSKPGAEWRDLDGVSRFYAHTPAPKAGWNIYVGEHKSSVLASVTQLRARQLKLMAIGMLLFLLAEALIYRKVASPIRRLSGAVRTARETDAREPVSVSGPAEVQTLAEDVNALTASVHRELHERRRTEESYRLLFETNPHPLFVYETVTMRFVAVNAAALDMFGYPREEFLGMTLGSILAAHEAERLQAAVDHLKSGSRGVLTHSGIWRGAAQGRIGVRHRGHHPRPCLRGPAGAHGDGTRRHRADGVRARPAPQRGSLPRPVRERERPDRHRRSRWPVDRRQRDVPPCPRLQPGGDGRDPRSR